MELCDLKSRQAVGEARSEDRDRGPRQIRRWQNQFNSQVRGP